MQILVVVDVEFGEGIHHTDVRRYRVDAVLANQHAFQTLSKLFENSITIKNKKKTIRFHVRRSNSALRWPMSVGSCWIWLVVNTNRSSAAQSPIVSGIELTWFSSASNTLSDSRNPMLSGSEMSLLFEILKSSSFRRCDIDSGMETIKLEERSNSVREVQFTKSSGSAVILLHLRHTLPNFVCEKDPAGISVIELWEPSNDIKFASSLSRCKTRIQLIEKQWKFLLTHYHRTKY